MEPCQKNDLQFVGGIIVGIVEETAPDPSHLIGRDGHLDQSDD